ncbi:MAG TPA: DUF3368 domain-containing protein [Bacteroidetes bacterium]|nr:DUF3368 domain-containing protein [Bacteroidota bacterium]
MLIVSDTSAISNLLLIDRLTLLKYVYQNIVIPPSVHTELLELAKFGGDISKYLAAEWIEIKTPSDILLIGNLLKDLDEGEAEAIVLAKELGADYLLIDERRGYKIADKMGLTAIGLIGVLLKAKSEGHIKKVLPIVDALRNDAGFWINDKFCDEIRILAGEQ